MGYDVILSAGYLAFARQTGFLDAVEQTELPVEGVCGTSSGAMVGAMWAAGMTARAIAEELQSKRPIDAFATNWQVWDGWAAFRLDPVVARLRELLPPRFEDLKRPFSCGVMTLDRVHVLLSSGPLPEAVAASCAIPRLFAPVRVGDILYADGGVIDRTAIAAFRALRGERPTLVHLVERSRGGNDGDLSRVPVVRSKRANASLAGIRDFASEFEATRRTALDVISGLRTA